MVDRYFFYLLHIRKWAFCDDITQGTHLRTLGRIDFESYTVEPVYNGHPRDLRNWPLNTGRRLIQDH